MSDAVEEQMEPIEESDLIEMAEAMIAEEERAAAERENILSNLGADIDKKLSDRMGRRGTKESQWLTAAKLYLGSLAFQSHRPTENDPFYHKEDTERTEKPEVNIVRVKCDAAISQTIAYQFAAGDKNWDIVPPAVVDDIDEQDMGMAQQSQGKPMRPEEVAAWKAGLMSDEIEYHLNCTRYPQEARLAMKNRVILGSAIMKLPRNTNKYKKVYSKVQMEDGSIMRVPTFTPESVPLVYSVDPWYFYPDDSVTDIRKAEDAIEVHLLSRTELRELLQRPDFFKDKLQEVLKDTPRDYKNSPFKDSTYITGTNNVHKGKYTVIEYHGPLTKDMLGTLGVCGCDDSMDEQYAEVWVINGVVVKLELSNLEGSTGVPYCMSVWEPDPGSVFGFGIPMLIRDQQRVVNETWKMLLDNAGLSAGPQVVVDTTLITPADGDLECTPFKVWYSTEFGADTSKAITFFTPPNSFEGLSSLFQLSKQLADEESSIPLMISGLSTPTGAGDSATAMALMNQNATSPLFYKSEEWDDDITSPTITGMYDWEMQFNPKEEIKSTYDIDVRTSTSYLRNTQDMQKLQALRQEIAQGSPMGEWINMDELTQVTLMGMKLPYKSIIKSPEVVAEERANAPEQPPDPKMIEAETNRMRLELDGKRLEMDGEIARVKAEQEQRMAEIQAQVQFGTNETRNREAEASVLKARYDFQSSMAAIASKDEVARAKIMADIRNADMNVETKLFLADKQHEVSMAQVAQKAYGDRERMKATNASKSK